MAATVAALLAATALTLACGGNDPQPTPTPAANVMPTATPRVETGPPPPVPGREAETDESASLPGVYVPPHPGADGVFGTGDDRNHLQPGTTMPICTPEQIAQNQFSSPLCYASNPPTSGPHASSFPNFTVSSVPIPKEMLVHSMEHGAVIIWTNTQNQTVIRSLQSIADALLLQRRLIVMSPYAEMEPDTIALTSWTRIDKMAAAEYDEARVLNFILAHERRFNPEGF